MSAPAGPPPIQPPASNPPIPPVTGPISPYPGYPTTNPGAAPAPAGYPGPAPTVTGYPGAGPAMAGYGRPRVYLPVVPTRYHQFWRAPDVAWWRPLLAIGAGIAGFFVLQVLGAGVGIGVDVARGMAANDSVQSLVAGKITPGFFFGNNLALAGLIPMAWVASVIVGQRPRWMSSVVPRIRWGWLMRCVLVVFPPLGLVAAFQFFADRPDLHRTSDTWFLLAVVLLTTPLQAAGEEFGFRGVLNRGVAAWIPSRLAAGIAGGVFSSLVFTLAHGASEPWLWVFYFTVGMATCYLAARTGGLEASIALHAVNNVIGLGLVPWMDISTIFDRGAGSAGPEILLQVAMVLVAAALVEWQARRAKLIVANDPGRAALSSAEMAPA